MLVAAQWFQRIGDAWGVIRLTAFVPFLALPENSSAAFRGVNYMLLEKVNNNAVLAGYVPVKVADNEVAPIMATFTIACPTTPAIGAGLAKAAGWVIGAGAVTGAAYAAYEVTNK